MGILVALVLLPWIFGLRLGFLTDYSFLIHTLLIYFSSLILSGFSIYGYVTILRGMHSFILFGCEDFMLQFSFHWIQLHLSVYVLTVVNLFRMAPAKSSNQNQNQDPPPPPPPSEAWQAVMAATNANTQLIVQILSERNQGNHGHGNNQNQFATLNQFLANGPKTFSNCVRQPMLTIGLWICVSISSAVTACLRTLSSLPPSNSKTKLQNGFSSTRILEEAV